MFKKIVLLAFFLCLWQGISFFSNDLNLIISNPLDIIKSLFINFDLILPNVINLIILATILILITILLGYVIYYFRIRYQIKFFNKLIVLYQIIPSIMLLPIFGMLFGFNQITTLIFSLCFSLFPILTELENHLQNIKNDEFNYLLKTYNISFFKYFIYYFVPSSVTTIHSSIQMIIIYANTNLILAQYFFGQNGLGALFKNAYANFNINLCWTIIIIVILLTTLLLIINKFIFKNTNYAKN